MKKRVPQKKIKQEVKPVIRFRESGNGQLAMVIGKPKKRAPKVQPQRIEVAVLDVLEGIEKRRGIENNAALLEHLFRTFAVYFHSKAGEQNDPLLKQISEKIPSLYGIAKQELKGKLKTNTKALARGQFVAVLLHFGMPQQPAFEAVAEWLGVSESTIHTAYYKYRDKMYLAINPKDFEEQILLSPYIPLFKEWFEKRPHFPTRHPESKSALKKLHEILQKAQKFTDGWGNSKRKIIVQ